MLCDKYKEALIEAAAGAALPVSIREHVDACARCRAKLAATRVLFAAADTELGKTANAEVPPSFLPKVRANLATVAVPGPKPIPSWTFVYATAALVIALGLLGLSRGPRKQTRTESGTVPSQAFVGTNGIALNSVAERKTSDSARFSKVRAQQKVSVAANEPEVLVQPEEEELLKRFYEAARNPARDARTIIADEHELPPKALAIERIEVRDLEIETLDEESGLAQTGTK
jgi:hypothetical protein